MIWLRLWRLFVLRYFSTLAPTVLPLGKVFEERKKKQVWYRIVKSSTTVRISAEPKQDDDMTSCCTPNKAWFTGQKQIGQWSSKSASAGGKLDPGPLLLRATGKRDVRYFEAREGGDQS